MKRRTMLIGAGIAGLAGVGAWLMLARALPSSGADACAAVREPLAQGRPPVQAGPRLTFQPPLGRPLHYVRASVTSIDGRSEGSQASHFSVVFTRRDGGYRMTTRSLPVNPDDRTLYPPTIMLLDRDGQFVGIENREALAIRHDAETERESRNARGETDARTLRLFRALDRAANMLDMTVDSFRPLVATAGFPSEPGASFSVRMPAIWAMGRNAPLWRVTILPARNSDAVILAEAGMDRAQAIANYERTARCFEQEAGVALDSMPGSDPPTRTDGRSQRLRATYRVNPADGMLASYALLDTTVWHLPGEARAHYRVVARLLRRIP